MKILLLAINWSALAPYAAPLIAAAVGAILLYEYPKLREKFSKKK